jgi:glycosyltransferase involved in cell wall biosynthesis
MTTDDLFFSVIVRTYKRPRMLKKCLDHLRQQSFDHNRYEIIVVDDGSGIFTRNLLETYAAAEPRLTAIFQPHSGLSSAHKTGAEKSRGDILIFFDDDCFAPLHWLSTYARIYAKTPSLDGAAGGIRLSKTFNLAGYKYYEGHTAYFDNLNGDLGMDSKTAGRVWFSFGANRSIRRDTWFKVQPEPGLWHFDDYTMDCKLRDIGAFIFYEPEAWVRHNYNLSRK